MYDEIMKNILAAMVCGVLAWGAKCIWKFLISPPKLEEKPNPETLRKQFFGFLILFIVSIITIFSFKSVMIRTISIIACIISFLAIWGSFDYMYDLAKNPDRKHSQ